MTSQQQSELHDVLKVAIDGMISYMKFGSAESEDDPEYDPTFDAGYLQKHVDSCAKILGAYLDALNRISGAEHDEEILSTAKKTILDLNKLNERCDGNIIETDQREQICELLILAAKYAGLTLEGDFTEEWREW